MLYVLFCDHFQIRFFMFLSLLFSQKEAVECAEVFADFVASFEDSRAAGKTFVRGNTINPETKGVFYSTVLLFSLLVIESNQI